MKQGWEYTTFADIMKPAKSERCGNRTDLPILSITMHQGIVFQSERFKKVIASKDTKDYKIIKDGQLVIAFPIDEGLIYTQDIAKEGIMSPAYIVWDVDYSKLNRKFLNIYFHCDWTMKYYKSKLRGTTLRRRMIPKEDLLALPIPVPPLAEQEKIVAELDCLSGIIEKKRQQLKELDALAQSIFYEMFGSIDDNHKDLECKQLSEVFSIIKDGTHQTPQYTEDKENGFKFLSAKDVVSGAINWSNIKYIPKDLHLELHKRIAPQRNDILLCKNGTYGICALVESDEVFDIYVSLALLRPLETFIPKFLVYAINNASTKQQFDKSIKGIGVPNLHLSEIKKTRIITPPIAMQHEFICKIESIEKQKELIKQSIAEVETLFNARMQEYFG